MVQHTTARPWPTVASLIQLGVVFKTMLPVGCSLGPQQEEDVEEEEQICPCLLAGGVFAVPADSPNCPLPHLTAVLTERGRDARPMKCIGGRWVPHILTHFLLTMPLIPTLVVASTASYM